MHRKQTLLTLAAERGWEVLHYHADGSGVVTIDGEVFLEFEELDEDWKCNIVINLPGSPNEVKNFWPQMQEELMLAVNRVLGCSDKGNA